MPAVDADNSQSGEDLLYASERVVVTNRRVLLKAASYTTGAITSVKVQSRPLGEGKGKHRRSGGATAYRMGLFIVGVGIAFCGAGIVLGSSSPFILFMFVGIGLLVGIIGILLISLGPGESSANTGGREYAVKFRTVDGSEERIKGLDRNTARAVADAISRATAGQAPEFKTKNVTPEASSE